MAKQAIPQERRKPIGKTPSPAERAAREGVEALHGRPLGDREWDRYSKRLTEFVKLLSRWDSEQRAPTKCAKMESKTDQERVA